MPESNQPLSVRDQVQVAHEAVWRAYREAWQLHHEARLIAGAGVFYYEKFSEAGIRELEAVKKISRSGVINLALLDCEKFTADEHQKIIKGQETSFSAAVRIVDCICRVLATIQPCYDAREVGDVYLRYRAVNPLADRPGFRERTGTDYHHAAILCISGLVCELLSSVSDELADRAWLWGFSAGQAKQLPYDSDLDGSYTGSKPWSENKKQWVVDAIRGNPGAIRDVAKQYAFMEDEMREQLQREYAMILDHIKGAEQKSRVASEIYLPPSADQFTVIHKSLRSKGRKGQIRRRQVGGTPENPRYHYCLADAHKLWPDLVSLSEKQR